MQDQEVACLMALAVPSLHLQNNLLAYPSSPSDGVSSVANKYTSTTQYQAYKGQVVNYQTQTNTRTSMHPVGQHQ